MDAAKLVGPDVWINQRTGEIIETQTLRKEVKGDVDVGFHKLWIGHILETIDEVGNAKVKVLFWLMRNMDSGNMVKATVRLRKEGYYARRLFAQVRYLGDMYWEKEARLEETQDSLVALSALRELWRSRPPGIPFMVSVTLRELVPANCHQLSLLVNPNRENLGPAMDRLNAKFGKGTVSIGMPEAPHYGAPVRIPFARIPDLEEF